jgi:hypothetical protein
VETTIQFKVNRAICTIVTKDFIPLANVLYRSLRENGNDFSFWVLVIDDIEGIPASEGKNIISTNQLLNSPVAKEIYDKYAHTNHDLLRWALKPVLISWLLENKADHVIFCDPDLYFIGKYEFIFEQLSTADVLLTPHWNNINVFEFEDGLFSIMRNGMYNAGFIASSKKGLPAMQWWAGVCNYKMERQQDLGVYDDQKYLDVLPIEFPGVQVLRHRGCNLASWNIDTCKRELINGKLMINKIYDPIFIHFAKDTISNILNRNDALLKPFFDKYIAALHDENFDLLKKLSLKDSQFHHTALYKIKHKFRLRTRFKRFLYNLAQKL